MGSLGIRVKLIMKLVAIKRRIISVQIGCILILTLLWDTNVNRTMFVILFIIAQNVGIILILYVMVSWDHHACPKKLNKIVTSILIISAQIGLTS